MCAACEAGEMQAGISPILAERARRIEAAMPGPGVSAEAWEIMLGRRGGALAWAETRRMMDALDRATQRLGAGLRCDAA